MANTNAGWLLNSKLPNASVLKYFQNVQLKFILQQKANICIENFKCQSAVRYTVSLYSVRGVPPSKGIVLKFHFIFVSVCHFSGIW